MSRTTLLILAFAILAAFSIGLYFLSGRAFAFIPLLFIFPLGFRRSSTVYAYDESDYCPECGNDVYPDDEFCQVCGRYMEK